MKKTILSISAIFWLGVCDAQSKKDTLMVDTTHVEKIKKMPIDSTHEKMPIAPLYPKDSVIRKTGDDEDPKTPKSHK